MSKGEKSKPLLPLNSYIEWQRNKKMLNISTDILDAKDDPRNPLENYKRITFSARYNKLWNTKKTNLSLAVNADYTGSFDNDKADPEINFNTEDKYSSSYNRHAINTTFNLSTKHNEIIKKISAVAAMAYEENYIHRTRFVQLQRDTPQPITTLPGESYAAFLPYKYYAKHTTENLPLNLFLKFITILQIPSKTIDNSTKLGIDYRLDKNFGQGQIFYPLKPLNPSTTIRLRKLSDLPAEKLLATLIEEKLTLPFYENKLEILTGIRGTSALCLPKNRALHNKILYDTRLNIGWRTKNFNIANIPCNMKFVAGIGSHNKFPTISQLYPEPIYLDLIQMYYYHIKPELRTMLLKTYIIDPTNPNLNAAKNIKCEIGTDINIGDNRLTLTYFKEKMNSGFRQKNIYKPFSFKQYDVSNINPDNITSAPKAQMLKYKQVSELFGYAMYNNGSLTEKQGIEYTFISKRHNTLHTRLTISGAWIQTIYKNSYEEMEKPNVVIDNKSINIVGIYKDNDATLHQMSATNFIIDNDLPIYNLGFSFSAQCLWYTKTKRLPLSNFPIKYMDKDGNIHTYKNNDYNDIMLKWLIRTYTETLFNTYIIPTSINVNLKMTKKIMKEKLSRAFQLIPS